MAGLKAGLGVLVLGMLFFKNSECKTSAIHFLRDWHGALTG
jgi:formate-dependent nitrite reductase membrane component NrfD